LRALALQRTDRFATAAAFIEALELAAARAGIEPAPARIVSAFVKGLALHVASPSDPAAATAELESSLPPLVRGRDAARALVLDDGDGAAPLTSTPPVRRSRRAPALWRASLMALIGCVGLIAGLIIAARIGRDASRPLATNQPPGAPDSMTAAPAPVPLPTSASVSAEPAAASMAPVESAAPSPTAPPTRRGRGARPPTKAGGGKGLPREL
jgi:hypothetical protein